MNVTLIVTLIGMVAIALAGVLGRSRPSKSVEEWTVGGRKFGTFATWFLQAGEAFTTFTFLAVAGIAFTGGVAATYAIPYLPIAFAVLYFVGPKVWRLGKDNGYITQADMYADRFRSPALGKLVAVVGVIFMLPYLQLQITGLGLVVQLVTGSASSGRMSMVIATVLTVLFVLWSGIKGLAGTAYLKDVLMVVAMVVLIVAVPAHYVGGIGPLFRQIEEHHAQLLTVATSGPLNTTWWLTGMLISAIGVAFMTTPHLWPAVLSARNATVLRRNYIFLPVYQICIILPVIIGFVGVLVLPKKTPSNGVLLTLANGALPGWLTGVIAVAAAASAMVPAAGICIGISTAVAHNLVKVRNPRGALLVNHSTVVVAAGLSLVLALARPDLLANLLLLTFSGLSQLAPGFIAAIRERVEISKQAVLAGLVVGVAVVIWGTFVHTDFGGFNVGLIGLGANIVVLALVEAGVRLTHRTPHATVTPSPATSIGA